MEIKHVYKFCGRFGAGFATIFLRRQRGRQKKKRGKKMNEKIRMSGETWVEEKVCESCKKSQPGDHTFCTQCGAKFGVETTRLSLLTTCDVCDSVVPVASCAEFGELVFTKCANCATTEAALEVADLVFED